MHALGRDGRDARAGRGDRRGARPADDRRGAPHRQARGRTHRPARRARRACPAGAPESGCGRARGRSTSSCTRASSSASPGSRATGRTCSCGLCAVRAASRDASCACTAGARDRARLARAAPRAPASPTCRASAARGALRLDLDPRELRAADARRATPSLGCVRPSATRAPAVARYVDLLRIKLGRSSDGRSRRSRGGNQQKVVIARWLASEPRDPAAQRPDARRRPRREARHLRAARRLAAEGIAVVMLSTEVDEHDRADGPGARVPRGRVFAEFERRASLTRAMLVASFFGREQAAMVTEILATACGREASRSPCSSPSCCSSRTSSCCRASSPEQLRHERSPTLRALRARRDGRDARDPERRRRDRLSVGPLLGSSQRVLVARISFRTALGERLVAVPILLALGAAVGARQRRCSSPCSAAGRSSPRSACCSSSRASTLKIAAERRRPSPPSWTPHLAARLRADPGRALH